MPLKNKKIVVATNNEHKLKEIGEILKGFDVISAEEFVEDFNPEETGKTFCENALIKAKTVKKHVKYPVLADDSGLEVFALDGEPGIYSSRYSELGTDSANVEKLLGRLEGVSDRRARFSCCVVLIVDGEIIQKEGYVYGKIIDKPRGMYGFGYDPVFVPDGFSKTFAEMTPEEKNELSHRRRALELIKRELKKIYD